MALDTHTLKAGTARAVVSEHGGQVLEWSSAGRELLFLSPGADLSGNGAIRGGIPVCFPWFGPREGLPQHGFARTSRWHVVEVAEDRVRLGLRDDERTLTLWDHGFRAVLDVALTEQTLTLALEVRNASADGWEFTAAFHPYFRVPDSRTAEVRGLPSAAAEQVHAALRDGDVLDLRVPGLADATLVDGAALLVIRPNGEFDATQVWNPGADNTLADLPGSTWDEFVCVEPVRAQAPRALAPGEAVTLRVTLAAGAA